MLTGTPPRSITSNRPDTLVARFISRASSDPERVAFSIYPMGALQALGSLKWGDWITSARAASGAFLARHAEAGERVAIFADNRGLWPVAMMGAAISGLVVVVIPPDGTPDVVLAQLADSGAKFVVVDTMARFKVLRALQPRLAHELVILCDDLEPLRSSVAEGISEWDTWCRFGAQALQDYPMLRTRLSERIDALTSNSPATVTYDSGSSEGIVRTFETVMAEANVLATSYNLTFADRVACSQSVSQPLHALIGLYATIIVGSTVALIEHPSDTFSAARQFEATVLAGNTRTLARVRETLANVQQDKRYIRDAICELVGRHCRLLVSDGVYPAEFQSAVKAAGIALSTVYGNSWQTCICRNGPAQFDDNAIGAAFDGVDLRIADHSELQVLRSVHTASGALTRGDRADGSFTDDGVWLRTGHRVERSMAGSFRIVSDMKDMLEFSTGRLVSPHSIETALENISLVKHAMCDADGTRSLVAILSLDRKFVERWALTKGVVAPWEALVEHPVVYDELSRAIALINRNYDVGEQLTAFAPTDLEFSVHSGELDDSGKVVRSVVASRFRHVFAELHQSRLV